MSESRCKHRSGVFSALLGRGWEVKEEAGILAVFGILLVTQSCLGQLFLLFMPQISNLLSQWVNNIPPENILSLKQRKSFEGFRYKVFFAWSHRIILSSFYSLSKQIVIPFLPIVPLFLFVDWFSHSVCLLQTGAKHCEGLRLVTANYLTQALCWVLYAGYLVYPSLRPSR